MRVMLLGAKGMSGCCWTGHVCRVVARSGSLPVAAFNRETLEM